MKQRRGFFDWLCCTSSANELALYAIVPVNRNEESHLNIISTKNKNNSEIINTKLEGKEIKVL